MKLIKLWIVAISLLFLLCNCSKDVDANTICFVGDSMIANWDVEASFPNRITKNLGKDGAHIDYLNDIRLSNRELVILIGTNDLNPEFDDEQINEYAEKYENTVATMPATRVFLVSVLPTATLEKNKNIIKFNTTIKKWSSTISYIDYVDCYDRFIDENGMLKNDLTRDGLHLNDYGYIILTDAVQKAL